MAQVQAASAVVVPPDREGDEEHRDLVGRSAPGGIGPDEHVEREGDERDGCRGSDGEWDTGDEGEMERPQGREAIVVGGLVVTLPAASDQRPVDREQWPAHEDQGDGQADLLAPGARRTPDDGCADRVGQFAQDGGQEVVQPGSEHEQADRGGQVQVDPFGDAHGR